MYSLSTYATIWPEVSTKFLWKSHHKFRIRFKLFDEWSKYLSIMQYMTVTFIMSLWPLTYLVYVHTTNVVQTTGRISQPPIAQSKQTECIININRYILSDLAFYSVLVSPGIQDLFTIGSSVLSRSAHLWGEFAQALNDQFYYSMIWFSKKEKTSLCTCDT